MPLQIVKLLDPIQMSINGTFNPMGAYNAATDYAVGDQVDYNGSSYIMYNNAAAGTVPTNTSYWGLVAEKGTPGADGADSTVPGPPGADGADGLTVSVNSVTQVAGDISLTQDNIPDGTTNKAYTATEQTKLAGIETGADVTDATNVAAAGAIMDGDITGNGLMTRTAAGAYTNRTITGTTNQVTVTNGDGVSGNPTLSTPQDIHTGAKPTFSEIYLGTGGINTASTAGDTRIFGGTTNNGSGVVLGGSTHATIANKGFLRVGATSIVQWDSSALNPYTDSTYTLGSSSLYWSNTYTDRLYLNSTFNIDGAVAGTGNITGNLGILATSGSATHSLTLGSTSTGIALYNTADQTTNYERLRLFTSGGTSYRLYAEQGGSGQAREIVISGLGISTQALALNVTSANGFVESRGTSATANAIIHRISGTLSSTSATQYGLSIVPTLGQSSTAGYTALLINPTETATGSGAKLLIDAKVGGVSKFKVDNTGGIETTVAGGGIIMASPDGTRYKVTVANGGTLAVAAA